MWKLVDSRGDVREQFDDREIVALIKCAEIGPRTLMWRPGYDTWKPLADTELGAHLPVSVSTRRQNLIAPRLEDILGVARTLPPLAVIVVALQLTFLLFTLWQDWEVSTRVDSLEEWVLMQRAAVERMSLGEPTALEMFLRMLFVLEMLFSVVLVVQWLRWQFRAARNLRALGAADLRHTPTFGLLWWFVPGVNLFLPFLAMDELTRASFRPRSWREIEAPILLRFWWVAWFFSQAIVLLGWLTGWLVVRGESGPLDVWLSEQGFAAVWFAAGAMTVGHVFAVLAIVLGVRMALHISDSQLRQAADQVVERGSGGYSGGGSLAS